MEGPLRFVNVLPTTFRMESSFPLLLQGYVTPTSSASRPFHKTVRIQYSIIGGRTVPPVLLRAKADCNKIITGVLSRVVMPCGRHGLVVRTPQTAERGEVR